MFAISNFATWINKMTKRQTYIIIYHKIIKLMRCVVLYKTDLLCSASYWDDSA